MSPLVFSQAIHQDRKSILENLNAEALEVSVDFRRANEGWPQVSVIKKGEEVSEASEVKLALMQSMKQLEKITIKWYIQDQLNKRIVHVRFVNPLDEKVSIKTIENFIRGFSANALKRISVTFMGNKKSINLPKLNWVGTMGINIPANGYYDLSFDIKKIQALDGILRATLNIEAVEITIGDTKIRGYSQSGALYILQNTISLKKLYIQAQNFQ